MKALLLAVAMAGPALAAPLDTTQSFASVVLLPPEKTSVSDTSPDGAAPLLVHSANLAIGAFDATQGVLVGVRGGLRIEPNHGLMAYRNESGGDWDSVATLRTGWRLGSDILGPATQMLQRVVANRDAKVVIGTEWAPLGFATTAGLDRFIGTGTLTTTFNTAIGAFILDGGGGSVAIASVLAMTGNTGGPDTDGLTAAVDWSYEWLRHSQLSFSGDSIQDSMRLDIGVDRSAFRLAALGDAATTGADVLGWECTGDCDAFDLQLQLAQGVAAGESLDGSVGFIGGPGPHSASFVLRVADDDRVGAGASHRGHTLTIEVHAGAVPEPGTAVLALLGLAGIATRRQRRH